MLSTLLYILLGIVYVYFAVSVAYLFLFSVAGKFFYKKPKPTNAVPQKSIAILVPAYKEDGIILSTAQHLEQLNYPPELFDIYIIADSFQPETVERLKVCRVQVLEVSFEQSTKTKALNEAFRRITRPYDVALICDADNILARNFLLKINEAFVQGARAVQGRRVAKNLDTNFAILDACSEGINNTIFRQGANALGLSSAVIGSGMAFGFAHIRKILSETHAVGGFDKIVQLKIVENGNKIVYLNDAYIFDEKVESAQAFRQQRKRWVSTQFIYLKQFFRPSLRQLVKGNISYFNLAILNNVVLPRAFLLALLPLLAAASFAVGTGWGLLGVSLYVLYLFSLVVAVPRELVNKQLLSAVLSLPRAVMLMFGTLFQLRKANKTFIHTVHTKTEVSNTLFKDHVS